MIVLICGLIITMTDNILYKAEIQAYQRMAKEDKMTGLSIFMKSQTGRDFQFNERMVSAVAVIKIDVSEYTAKHRPIPIQNQKQLEK